MEDIQGATIIQSFKDYVKSSRTIWTIILTAAFTALAIYKFSNTNFAMISSPNNVKLEIKEDLDPEESTELNEVLFVPKVPKYIAIHCSANPPRDISKSDLYRLFFIERGWKHWGYNYFVNPDGTILTLNGVDDSPYLEYSEVVNSVSGHNSETIAICYSGGTDEQGNPKNTLTKQQEKSIRMLTSFFQNQFKGIKVLGHRDFPGVHKACPSFTVGHKFDI